MGTPEGFIGLAFFSRFQIIMMIYSIMVGLRLTANDEDAGIMDMVLANPIPRWRVIVEKFVAFTLILIAIVVVAALGLVIGEMAVPLEVNMGIMLQSMVNMIPGNLFMIALTAMIATLVRRRTMAIAISVAVIMSSYVVNIVGGMATDSFLDNIRRVSFFYYYDTSAVLRDSSLPIPEMLLLLVGTVILVGGAVTLFNRRDVGV
jgi:ABC-2 type transport system permease protein